MGFSAALLTDSNLARMDLQLVDEPADHCQGSRFSSIERWTFRREWHLHRSVHDLCPLRQCQGTGTHWISFDPELRIWWLRLLDSNVAPLVSCGMLVQGDADSAFDRLWAKKKSELGQ